MADDQAPHDWQPLSCICNSLGRLDHPLYRRLTHDDYPREYRLLALESALRSGKIPLHGRRVTALGLEAPERIETKIDVETAIDITLDEVTLRNRCDSEADLVASCRPHERPAKVIETAPEWMPSDETRARIAATIPRNGPPHFPAVDIEFAVFQHVEADIACVERCLRESYLPAEGLADEPLTIFALARPDSETKAKILKEAASRAGKVRARQKSHYEWKQWRQPALKEFKRKLRETPGLKQEALVRHIRRKVDPACVDSTLRAAISKWKRRLNRFLPLMQKRKTTQSSPLD
jgi:hypothetical protein